MVHTVNSTHMHREGQQREEGGGEEGKERRGGGRGEGKEGKEREGKGGKQNTYTHTHIHTHTPTSPAHWKAPSRRAPYPHQRCDRLAN